MAKKDKSDDLHPLERANEKGYLGIKVDPTPNSAYTVAGVTSGEPTPETDDDTAAQAKERTDTLAENQ